MPTHRLWPHGRGRLYLGDFDSRQKQIGLEWSLGRRQHSCGISVRLNAMDGDRGVRLFLGIPWLIAFWLTFEGFMPRYWLPGHWYTSKRDGKRYYRSVEREIGIRIFDGTIWFSLWENPMGWGAKDPWWWQFNVCPVDILLGRQKYSDETIRTGRCIVPMPEGGYWASYKVFESAWKRPRWPWPKRATRVEIENDEPIPLPGKGTMPYNCDDDACYWITMALKGSVADAAREYAEDIVRDRIKLCGREIYP